MINNKNIFIDLWKNYLNEDLNMRDDSIIQNLAENLKLIKNEILDPEYSNWHKGNEKRQDTFYEFGHTLLLLSQTKNIPDLEFNREDRLRDRQYYLEKYGISELELDFIAEGAERYVFNINDVDNIVLKASMDKAGAISNLKELNVSRGQYGKGSSQLFTKTYLYDLDPHPEWIITEKLERIYGVDENEVPFFDSRLSGSDIKKIFPTLSSIFKLQNNTEGFVRASDDFLKYLVEFIEERFRFSMIPTNVVNYELLIDVIENIKEKRTIDYVNPEYFMYDNLNPNYESDLSLLNTYEDLNRLVNHTKENLYHDFSLANVGIDKADLRNNNLSPKSIKALDLSYNHPVYDKKIYEEP